jgi:hypothetical protein
MQLHYVEAVQLNWTQKRAKVGGPYESGLEALDAIKVLAPKYPNCHVRRFTENVPMKKAAALLGGPKIEEGKEA